MPEVKACVGYVIFKYLDVEVDDDRQITDKGEETLLEQGGISLCAQCRGWGEPWSVVGPEMTEPVYMQVGGVIEEDVIGTLTEARNLVIQERDEARARLVEARRIIADLRAELLRRNKVSQ